MRELSGRGGPEPQTPSDDGGSSEESELSYDDSTLLVRQPSGAVQLARAEQQASPGSASDESSDSFGEEAAATLRQLRSQETLPRSPASQPAAPHRGSLPQELAAAAAAAAARRGSLPQELAALTGLQDLVLMGCSGMKEVPAWVMGMPGLRVPFEERRVRVREEGQETEAVVRVRPDLVDLSGRKSMVELPVWLQEGAGNVKELAVSSQELKVLPGWLGDLTLLKQLNLRWCSGLTGLPESVGGLTALQVLDLDGCSGLTGLPESVGG